MLFVGKNPSTYQINVENKTKWSSNEKRGRKKKSKRKMLNSRQCFETIFYKCWTHFQSNFPDKVFAKTYTHTPTHSRAANFLTIFFGSFACDFLRRWVWDYDFKPYQIIHKTRSPLFFMHTIYSCWVVCKMLNLSKRPEKSHTQKHIFFFISG